MINFDWQSYLSRFSWGDDCAIHHKDGFSFIACDNQIRVACHYSDAEKVKPLAELLVSELQKKSFVLVLTGDPTEYEVAQLFYELKCPHDWDSVKACVWYDGLICSSLDGELPQLIETAIAQSRNGGN